VHTRVAQDLRGVADHRERGEVQTLARSDEIGIGDRGEGEPATGALLEQVSRYAIEAAFVAERGFPVSLASSATATFFIASGIGGVIAGRLVERIDARFVIATGSEPLVPPIPGLDQVSFLTNETVFGIEAAPQHLLVLGGGPIGCELAQAHRRLGAEVTVIEMSRILPKDDEDASSIVRESLIGDGVRVIEGGKAVAVERTDKGIIVEVERNGSNERLSGSHLLIAVGRRPSVAGLNLEAAGVAVRASRLPLEFAGETPAPPCSPD
jgi:NADPH-dependent 2,4-dienoyl-CoA reductase/sulfur reductase-like enzyme